MSRQSVIGTVIVLIVSIFLFISYRHDGADVAIVQDSTAVVVKNWVPDTDLPSDDDNSNPEAEVESGVIEYPPVKFLTNSLYPLSPYNVFTDNYEKAVNGDVEAQYLIYKVFSECSAVSRNPETRAKLIEIYDDPAITQDYEFRLERCKKFEGSDDDFKEEKKLWYTLAYKGGHPLVVAWHEVMYNEDRTFAQSTLADALETGSHEAFDTVALFLGMKGTDQFGGNTEEYSDPWVYTVCQNTPGCDLSSYEYKIKLETEPWNYLSCKRNPGCNIEQYEQEFLGAAYEQVMLQGIISRATELENLIAEGRTDELGL